MRREHSAFLAKWLASSSRKPLVVRGARQVGKTWLIRDLARSQNRQLFEINFEKRPESASLFSSNDPREISLNIQAATGRKMRPSEAILFLDEIQAAPQLLSKLRWFAEDMPELAVIAAGSLLDFALAKHEFSMPVGRIGYLYLEPLSLEEFLEATGHGEMKAYLQAFSWGKKIPSALHEQLLKLTKEYMIIGGMPAAVSSWAEEKSLSSVNQIHFDLLATYRDDFAKYSGRLPIERLEEVIRSIPLQLGKKFIYKEVDRESSASSFKQALDLLSKARLCHRVVASAANGLPLGAEANEKFFKVLLLDIGLCSASLGLSLHQLQSVTELSLINNGAIAEQLAGQLLRTIDPPYISPSLHYWLREKKGASAEVDYLLQHENQVIAVEVKAGKTGTLKSLHQFMKEKKRPLAVRINSDIPQIGPVSLESLDLEYTLLSIPFYLEGQLPRLLKEAQ